MTDNPADRPAATRRIKDARAMEALGAQLAGRTCAGTVYFLYGDLGSGKTTLVRGFLHALGYRGAVKSPSYTLVEPYRIADLFVYHFDLYRISSPDELETLGARDYFGQDAVCLVEWPERARGALGQCDIEIHIDYAGRHRSVSLVATTAQGSGILP